MYRHLRTKLHTTSRIFSPYPVTEDDVLSSDSAVAAYIDLKAIQLKYVEALGS